MGFRRVAGLAAALLLSSVSVAHADKIVEPRAGVLLTGDVQFPRAQSMSVRTDATDGSRLTVAMAFDGRCTGGGLGELWASNVVSQPTVRAAGGRFAATLTGTMKQLGGVDGRVGHFRWRFSGRFTQPDVIVATVSGSAQVTVAGKVVSRCRIAKPAPVRLTVH